MVAARRVGDAVRRGTLRYVNVVEAAIASVIAAIALGGLLFASAAAARFGTHQTISPAATASQRYAQEILRTAEDAWKYAAPGAPAPQLSGRWNASVPVAYPGADPTSIPVTVDVTASAAATPAPNDVTRESAAVTVTVDYGGGTATAQSVVHVKAPVPGSVVDSGITVTPPPGAP